MKKLFFFLTACLLAIGLTSCNKDNDYTLHIYDEAHVLTQQDGVELRDMFKGTIYNEVYLFTVPDSMSYAESMSYRSPKDKVRWRERRNVFRVYYFPNQKWVRVSVPSNRENDFQRKYALPLYHIQHDADKYADPMEDILVPIMTGIVDLTSKRVAWFSVASSILSVVDYLNERLILPSHNLLHLLFFRLPLCISLIWVHVFKGFGWPIFLMVLLLIGLTLARDMTDKHVWLYGILYGIHLLVLVCLVFLTVPSFDTMQLVTNMGFVKAGAVLDASYMNAAAMEHTWVGGVIFIILYLIHRILSYYMKKDLTAGDSDDEQMDKKAETFGDKAWGTTLMFILVFMMPKYIVWAVCAYLIQQIICSDLLRQSKPHGKPASSIIMAAAILLTCAIYFMAMLDWWIGSFRHIDVTYQWLSNILAPLASMEGLWGEVFDMIFTLLPLAGLGALAMFTFLHSWFGLDEAITYAATHGTTQEVHKEATGQLALKALGWMILLWLTSLLCLWYAAVYANAGF